MWDITVAQIKAARSKDAAAITAILAETEERIAQLAWRHAQGDKSIVDDLAQAGRMVVWEAVANLEFNSVAQLFSYIDTRAARTMDEERRKAQQSGITKTAAKDFGAALAKAGGDPHEAERIATSEALMGPRRMSREMARAARLSWQGEERLDAPLNGNTLADVLVTRDGLVEASDIISARRRQTRDRVHAVLAKLGDRRERVVRATFGITPEALYGSANDDELAADLGLSPYQVQQARTRGLSRFAELYLAGA